MTFHSYGISLPCCTSSGPLALVVCGICPVACDTLLCAAQRGNVFPSCFCFLLQSLQIYQDSVINPAILPTFFAKEPFFAVFFYTIAGNPLPRAMPHQSLVPNSSLCIPRSDAAASELGRNTQPDDPTHGKTKNARRCMGIRSALRWQMQCAAWAHAPHCVFGSRTAGL